MSCRVVPSRQNDVYYVYNNLRMQDACSVFSISIHRLTGPTGCLNPWLECHWQATACKIDNTSWCCVRKRMRQRKTGGMEKQKTETIEPFEASHPGWWPNNQLVELVIRGYVLTVTTNSSACAVA